MLKGILVAGCDDNKDALESERWREVRWEEVQRKLNGTNEDNIVAFFLFFFSSFVVDDGLCESIWHMAGNGTGSK